MLPKWSQDDDENTHIVATASDTNSLVTQDSCYFCRFTTGGDQFLSCKCNRILRTENIDAISGSELTRGAVRSFAISSLTDPLFMSSDSSSNIALIPILNDLSPNALVIASSPITRL